MDSQKDMYLFALLKIHSSKRSFGDRSQSLSFSSREDLQTNPQINAAPSTLYRMDGARSNLVQWKVSLPMEGGWNWVSFQSLSIQTILGFCNSTSEGEPREKWSHHLAGPTYHPEMGSNTSL